MGNPTYPGLRKFVIEGLEKGLSSPDMYKDAVEKFKYKGGRNNFSLYCADVRRRPPMYKYSDTSLEKSSKELTDAEKFEKIISKEKNISVDELASRIEKPKNRIRKLVEAFRSHGKEVAIIDERVVFSKKETIPVDIDKKPLGKKELIFATMSDLHFGSKHVQITAMHEFAKECKKEGVSHIFVPGDVCAGKGVYAGQEYDLHLLSAEEQEDSVVVNLPKGFEYYALGGNHDYAFIKRGSGHNCLKAIENRRDDFTYIGFDEAVIPILPGVDMMLWHPSGGLAYALSYKLQKGAESIAHSELYSVVQGIKNRPTLRFLLAGHTHTQLQALFGGMLAMQCGCFEGRTNLCKRNKLTPAIGGWIIKACLGRNGKLKRFNTTFYMYDEIIDDYKNYDHEAEYKVITDPIMF